ncbi:protein of unknown function [Methylorubrum extorquens DM4]|uniref:site-specific DNA-methyltransferase (adenine-specific) n=1 Tax=Methylorubrum extorquens (strain DSM 6343 / CIP 106787 / DM4) TaxID=661410 RepID=C7CEP6_METED|nr:N-6 DNA methylase [Methylorubrum extorquens]CAX25998.1 protein of unknown function [Methylorubrum extorquens DM4]
MGPQGGIIAELARVQGLARAPLFRPGEIPDAGSHEILLDGRLGSFAVSVAGDIDPYDASSWAWSSNVPHHVLFKGDDVHVRRWDLPGRGRSFERRRIMEHPADFYEYLRQDRTDDRRSVVEHSMQLFRKVRNLVLQGGLDDALSTRAYLTLLGALASGLEPHGAGLAQIARTFRLPEGSTDLLSVLPQASVESLMGEFAHVMLDDVSLAARPVLSLRHASGAIFQEAHHQLLDGPPLDLFGYVGPARSARPKRGVVHFTPPSLARSLCEQALSSLGGLASRANVVVADFACGSGAFLVEALRSLERGGYAGRVTLVGRDISTAAIDMARFVLDMAGAEWPGRGRFDVDLAVADTLRSEGLPMADLIVMNPPFAPWQGLSEDERSVLAESLGRHKAGRPDISMGFVLRALGALRTDGALAVLLPASALETKAAEGWRGRISEGRSVYLDAVFDNHRMFTHALVRLGALVIGPRGAGEQVEIRAGGHPEAAGDALRALRRGSGFPDGVGAGAFTLTRIPASASPQAWVRKGPSKTLTERALSSGATTVGALFEVQQGIRTGQNKAFVLDDEGLAALPAAERRYFRPAITNDGIKDGRITRYAHVFYPYDGSGFTVRDEAALAEALPVFLQQHLEPWRQQLAGRRSRSRRWWGLGERRRMLEEGRPFLVSKYWGDAGSFVLRDRPDAVVLQGYGWFPSTGRPAIDPSSDVASAYLALVNTKAFFRMVAEHAPPTGGGQLNLGRQYMVGVPMVDLTAPTLRTQEAVQTLATFARRRYVDRSDVSDAHVEALVRRLFGADEGGGADIAPAVRAMPAWMLPLVEAGRAGTGKDVRYDVLVRIQDLAKEGTYGEIDAALAEAPVEDLADTSLMTVLRGTYRFRSRLACWNGFRDRVAAEYGNRDMPVAELMYGLYE